MALNPANGESPLVQHPPDQVFSDPDRVIPGISTTLASSEPLSSDENRAEVGHDPGPEAVQAFFDRYFSKTWNRRTEEKELYRTVREVNRLRKLYPELYEAVLNERLHQDDPS